MEWEFAWVWDPGLSYRVPQHSRPVAGGGLLYLPTGVDGVWAISETTGQTAWRNTEVDSRCSAAYDPELGVLYVAGVDGVLYLLDPTTGDVQGTFSADEALSHAPLVVGNVVLVASKAGTLYAIGPDAREAWRYSAGSAAATMAAYSARYGLVIFATADLHVHAVRIHDGSRAWRVKPTQNGPSDVYTFEGGWPVVADDAGIVFIRLRQPWDAMYHTGAEEWWPPTNAQGRDWLRANPAIQTLFALRLEHGGTAFVANVGPGGMEYRWGSGFRIDVGPMPAVVGNVGYVPWRSGQKCQAGLCWDARWDTVMGELDLNTGDLRFLEHRERSSDRGGLITDEQGYVTAYRSGDSVVICYAHWVAGRCYRITDSSGGRGDTFLNPIRTNAVGVVVSNMDSCRGGELDAANHHCSGLAYGDEGTRTYQNAFYVWHNRESGPPRETGQGPGTPLYWIDHNGQLYYLDDWGAIIALRSKR